MMMERLKPSAAQLEFMDWEMGAFFHFGVRTFNENHRDWDREPMPASTFNPSSLDCVSWLEAVKAAGMKYAVLIAKHHDGFANWPSAYTEYSVKNSPWKGGNGDVVREFIDACRKVGIKAGLYYSCAQVDTAENDSEYDDFVIGQLTELLTNYGKIDILWFDACGADRHSFDSERIAGVIRSLAPNILVFGPWTADIRWIGNEWGCAPMNNTNFSEGRFMPGECDCCVTRDGCENYWFYNETHKDCRRTAQELVGMYYYSVGRGSNFLLNIAPDRRGLLPDEEKALLTRFAAERRRFTDRPAQVKSVTREMFDGRAEYRVELCEHTVIDTVVICEDMTDGESVREFTVSIAPHDDREGRIAVFKGFTIGHKRICTFPPMRAKIISLIIDEADGEEKISEIIPLRAEG